MISKICSSIYVLAQNATEKMLTKVGLAFFAFFLLILIIDATVKNKWVPKSKQMLAFIVFLFIATIIALILLLIYYK